MTVEEEYRKEETYIRANSKKVKNTTNGISYCCLYHDDNVPSASHVLKNGKVLDYCSVCGNIHIKLKKDSGAWEEYCSKEKYSKFETFLYYNTQEEYKYYDLLTGKYLYSVFRLNDKRKGFPVGVRDGTHVISGTNSVNSSLAVFTNNVKRLLKAISEGELIIYTEGEKDSITVHNNGFVSFTCGGTNKFRKAILPYLKGGRFVVFSDNDSPGKKDAEHITALLNTVGSAIMIIPPDVPENGDISDYMENHSKEDLKALINDALKGTVTEKIGESNSLELSLIEVKGMLSYDEHGKVLQTVKNFEVVLENDSRFVGKIGFNEFSRQMSLTGSVPWDLLNNSCRAWGNHDDSALFSIIQTDYGLRNRNDYFDSVKIVSMRNKFHPVRNLLDSLPWKGIGHIKRLLVDYLGAEETEYQYQVLKLWILGAVSRIYKPGFKFDYTLILLGPQGLGKSTFLRLMALMDEWYNDSLDNLDSDKTAQSLMGSWIIELAELKSLARTSGGIDSIKRFLTAQQDKFRAPYERRAEIIQRQCVFSGTTNHEEFLQDLTGNRRFLIVEVGINKPNKSLFAPEVVEDIKAAWAEAVHIFKTENPELILPEEFREQAEKLQNQSLVDDGKTGIIEAYLEDKTITCAVEVWQEALNESGRPAKWQAIEINEIISKLDGWKKMKSPTNIGKFGRQRGFRKNDTKTVTENSTADEFVAIGPSETIDLPFE